MNNTNIVSTRIDLPVELHKQMKVYCASKSISIKDLIVISVTNLLNVPMAVPPPAEKKIQSISTTSTTERKPVVRTGSKANPFGIGN